MKHTVQNIKQLSNTVSKQLVILICLFQRSYLPSCLQCLNSRHPKNSKSSTGETRHMGKAPPVRCHSQGWGLQPLFVTPVLLQQDKSRQAPQRLRVWQRQWQTTKGPRLKQGRRRGLTSQGVPHSCLHSHILAMNPGPTRAASAFNC